MIRTGRTNALEMEGTRRRQHTVGRLKAPPVRVDAAHPNQMLGDRSILLFFSELIYSEIIITWERRRTVKGDWKLLLEWRPSASKRW